VSESTAEAELIALGMTSMLGQGVSHLLSSLGVANFVNVLGDNQASLAIAGGSTSWRSRHFAIRSAAQRERICVGMESLSYVGTKQHAADIMTKGLAEQALRDAKALLNMSDDVVVTPTFTAKSLQIVDQLPSPTMVEAIIRGLAAAAAAMTPPASTSVPLTSGRADEGDEEVTTTIVKRKGHKKQQEYKQQEYKQQEPADDDKQDEKQCTTTTVQYENNCSTMAMAAGMAGFVAGVGVSGAVTRCCARRKKAQLKREVTVRVRDAQNQAPCTYNRSAGRFQYIGASALDCLQNHGIPYEVQKEKEE
jgi:hypothetical protein